MATKVFDTVELELQDGTVVKLKPLNIKGLRKFMEVVGEMDGKEESESLDAMVTACGIALEWEAPELVADRDKLEEALDVPTMWKIVEIAGGIKQTPKLQAAME